MRVLIAHSFYRQAGGEDRYVRQQVALLREAYETRLLERENLGLPGGVRTATHMLYSRAEVRSVTAAMRDFGPDVVHVHNTYPSFGPAVHLSASRLHVPLVMTVHNLRLRCPNGVMFTEGERCRRCEAGAYYNAVLHGCFAERSQAAGYAAALWTHRFVARLEDRVQLFVAPSRFMAEQVQAWGIPAARTVVVRNFTDLALGEPGGGDGGLYLGRLAPEKGVADLLRALQAAGDPPFRIAGDGPEAASLRALADELGLRHTSFVGLLDREQVTEAIRRARYVAFPSVWDENAPLAALEAMAAGRPLLVTRRGGLPELVDDGGGVICEVDDPVTSLAAGIGRLQDDPAFAASEGAKAMALAGEAFRPERHLADLSAVYARVTHAGAQGAGSAAAQAGRLPAQAPIGAPAGAASAPAGVGSAALPRVLMSHCYYRDLGGENLSFEAEAQLLRDAGVDVTTYTRDNRELDRLGAFGKATAGLRAVWAGDTYRDLRERLMSDPRDIVHFQNTFPLISPAAFYAAHRQGAAVVASLRNYRFICPSAVLYRDGHPCEDCIGHAGIPGVVHGCYHESRVQSGVVATMQNVHGLLGTWHRAVDLFVAPSEFTRQKFIQAGLDPARIVVKPNFVAPDPGPNDTAGDHAVYAGRLAPEKGVMTMLRAWQAIDMPLRIIGDGPLHEAVEAYVRDHDLGSRVTLMGHRAPAEVLAQLRDARVVVFPSEWYETFGRVIAEAYACGVPVIASRLGAMAEVVRHGETGLLFTAGSAQELTAAVEQLRRPGADYESMRREARLEYERTFTAERNRVLLLEIYERARRVRDARGVRSSSPRSV